MMRVLVLEARLHPEIADGLLAGAVAELAQAGVEHSVMSVPGVLELPAALSYVVAAMERQTVDDRYDGFVALGCAIRGETDRYDHICSACMQGLQHLALTNSLAIGNGVLAVHDQGQALERCRPDGKNIGGLAARACLRMIDLKRSVNLIRP